MSADNFDNKVQIKLNVTIKPPTYRPTFCSLSHADKLCVCVCVCVCGARCGSCDCGAEMLLSSGGLEEVQENQ